MESRTAYLLYLRGSTRCEPVAGHLLAGDMAGYLPLGR